MSVDHVKLGTSSAYSATDSLMHEESVDPQFVSEYSYSDQDSQFDRKRSLERHSSSDVTDIPIVKIIESQAAQSESEAAKPIVTYVSSFFGSGTSTSSSKLGWLSGTSSKKDPRRLTVENLLKLKEPADVLDALNRAIELKNAMYTQAALDLVTNLCEKDKTKTTSVSLGAEGACSVVDHLLAQNLGSLPLAEAALRAICSLITPPHPKHDSAVNIAAASSSICISSTEAGVSNNRKRFSSAGSVYQVIRAATTHLADEVVLEWGLRVLFYLSLEPGERCCALCVLFHACRFVSRVRWLGLRTLVLWSRHCQLG